MHKFRDLLHSHTISMLPSSSNGAQSRFSSRTCSCLTNSNCIILSTIPFLIEAAICEDNTHTQCNYISKRIVYMLSSHTPLALTFHLASSASRSVLSTDAGTGDIWCSMSFTPGKLIHCDPYIVDSHFSRKAQQSVVSRIRRCWSALKDLPRSRVRSINIWLARTWTQVSWNVVGFQLVCSPGTTVRDWVTNCRTVSLNISAVVK